jgi:hypothetical protein
MPPKSVWKIVEYIKHEYEEWGGDPQIDEASLYRHVEEMLDLEREPPELAPAEIVEKEVRLIFCVEVEVTDTVDNETTRGHLGSPTEIQAAAHWAWLIFRDFFGEYPPTGDENGYVELVHRVLQVRRCHIVEQLPPLS